MPRQVHVMSRPTTLSCYQDMSDFFSAENFKDFKARVDSALRQGGAGTAPRRGSGPTPASRIPAGDTVLGGRDRDRTGELCGPLCDCVGRPGHQVPLGRRGVRHRGVQGPRQEVSAPT